MNILKFKKEDVISRNYTQIRKNKIKKINKKSHIC